MTQVSRRSAALATLAGNGATVAITVAQAFLLIPLALRYLDASLYGAWLAATELLIWIQFLDGGLPNLLTQRAGAAVGRSDHVDAARWASTCFAGLAAICIVLGAVAALASPMIGTWTHVPPEKHDTFVNCFRVGVLASLLLLLSNGCVGLARGVQRTSVVNATQVAGALAGLVVSMALLAAGAGLWAFPVGLLVRALMALVGALLFLGSLPAPVRSWWGRPSRAHARELRTLVPSMSAASIGNVVANNSEVLLVNTFLGPVAALSYALTRRAFDGIRSLLDTIAWAVAGGFAHVVTAEDRHRARDILGEVLWVRLAVACLAAGIVLAVNQPFVELLFGPANFGGRVLTLAFALQTVLVGQGFLVNFLWRAAGHVRQGSWMLAAEAVARVAAITAGLKVFGSVGAPVAAIVVSLVMLQVTRVALDASLPDGTSSRADWMARLSPWVVLGVGIVGATVRVSSSWLALCAWAAGIGLAGLVLLWYARPVVSGGSLLRWSQR